MKEVVEQIRQIEFSSSDTKCYFESLLRLLDKIEVDEMDQILNDDLANIYRLLSLLEPNHKINSSTEHKGT